MQRSHWLFFAAVALVAPMAFFLAIRLVPNPTSLFVVIGAGALLVGVAVGGGLALGIRWAAMEGTR